MKNLLSTISYLFILISCQNNHEVKLSDDDDFHQPTLAPCINDAFDYFINHDKNSDSSTYYAMDFMYMDSEFPTDDTMIWIAQQNCHMDTDGFKGYTDIGDYKLLVFDNHDVGHIFYNQDSLKYINLGSLRFPTNPSVGPLYIVKGNLLELLGRQPEDYEPIKIQ